MSLSKIDLLNVAFSSSMLGYSKPEVDRLVQEMAETLGQMAEERKELKGRVLRLEESLAEYRKREEAMRETLLSTQRMVDEMTAQARKEGQLILDEAQAKAADIVRQAHQRLGQVHDDIANVKRWRSEFQTRFKGLLETYLRLLDTRDPDVERMEEMEAKLTFLKKAK